MARHAAACEGGPAWRALGLRWPRRAQAERGASCCTARPGPPLQESGPREARGGQAGGAPRTGQALGGPRVRMPSELHGRGWAGTLNTGDLLGSRGHFVTVAGAGSTPSSHPRACKNKLALSQRSFSSSRVGNALAQHCTSPRAGAPARPRGKKRLERGAAQEVSPGGGGRAGPGPGAQGWPWALGAGRPTSRACGRRGGAVARGCGLGPCAVAPVLSPAAGGGARPGPARPPSSRVGFIGGAGGQENYAGRSSRSEVTQEPVCFITLAVGGVCKSLEGREPPFWNAQLGEGGSVRIKCAPFAGVPVMQ